MKSETDLCEEHLHAIVEPVEDMLRMACQKPS